MIDEPLPESWPIAGTTGYDFLNAALHLFIDPRAETPLTDFYAEFTGESTDFAALARDKKHLVMRDLFASDINRLTAQMADVCESCLRYRDYARRDLNSMIREVIACLSVYRTYIRAEKNEISEQDKLYINQAIDAAKANRPDIDAELFDFFRGILLLESRGQLQSELVMRFQQSTGPVTAKGIEDTLFYCFNRFAVLNEVGGAPDRFSISPEEFHKRNQNMLQHWPHTMLATTTHDTKRGEDVRMRLAVLSEMPNRWATAVRNWNKLNNPHRTQLQPERNIEYLFYQTLVGAWPIETDRLQAYMLKAAREAKQFTSWSAPNEEYERALAMFIDRAMQAADFRAQVDRFVAEIKPLGYVNSLAQTLLKLTVPGVPDIYQGAELWDFRLVDPDNRTPVDYDLRRQLLEELDDLPIEKILARWDDALPKLWVIRRTLAFRKSNYELFTTGKYQPAIADGSKSDHVVAFNRAGSAITIVPRFPLALNNDWQDTAIEIPPGKWRNLFTGDAVAAGRRSLSELLRRFPVALLVIPNMGA